MERKQWLKTFLGLVDKGAPMVEYRKRLRLFAQVVPNHLKKIGDYRRELANIEEDERDRANRKNKEKLKAQRREEASQRRLESSQRQAARENAATQATDSVDGSSDTSGDSEAVGTREDSDED